MTPKPDPRDAFSAEELAELDAYLATKTVPPNAYALAQAALQAAPILGSMERAHKVVDAILKRLAEPQ